MAIPLIVAVGIRIGWWAATRIAARQAAKSAAQAAARAATSTAGRQALSTASGISTAIQTAEMAQKLIEEAEDETSDQDITCPTGQCNEQAKQEEDKKKEEQEKKKQELKDESTLTDKHPKTNNWEKEGTWDDANKDFDDMQPNDVKDIESDFGKGRTGVLEDGNHINVRPGHRGHPDTPTLEIRPPKGTPGKTDKFRYKPPRWGA